MQLHYIQLQIEGQTQPNTMLQSNIVVFSGQFTERCWNSVSLSTVVSSCISMTTSCTGTICQASFLAEQILRVSKIQILFISIIYYYLSKNTFCINGVQPSFLIQRSLSDPNQVFHMYDLASI